MASAVVKSEAAATVTASLLAFSMAAGSAAALAAILLESGSELLALVTCKSSTRRAMDTMGAARMMLQDVNPLMLSRVVVL